MILHGEDAAVLHVPQKAFQSAAVLGPVFCWLAQVNGVDLIV